MVGGLSLRGVPHRPPVGLLHVAESLRMLRVGWNLKNPRSAVWVVASTDHITVLFSPCPGLVAPDSPVDKAVRAFDSRDPDSQGFVRRDELGSLLGDLGLCTDEEYLSFMVKELDPDNLGKSRRFSFFTGKERKVCDLCVCVNLVYAGRAKRQTLRQLN